MKLGSEIYLKKKEYKRKIDSLLELPREVVSNEPKITMVGFEEILIENYKNILEYEDHFIKLNTHIGAININGFHLKLIQMTEEDIRIIGKIDSMDFESMISEEDEEVK